MAYQVLARKWRPADFASLIGQEPIVTALQNALAEGRLAQAYLFSGIRGVGKTTAARVLAKAVNCERGPAPDPCNECPSCKEITEGSSLDVIEIDAATYSKVEQVRELTESLQYGPARGRYKVVVIDEIHRLSRQAFDALLKIVEEPPPHLIFVFATTEIEAVPATILSRCQEFHFRRVPAARLAEHLRRIAGAEGIEASDTALRLLARAAEGSVRDAVALLDQLATFGGGTISDESAAELLGGLDLAFLQELLEAILAGEADRVSRLARSVEERGFDPRHAYSQLLSFCRDALHLALGEAEGLDLPEEARQALAPVAREAGYENLLRLINQLLTAEATVRQGEAAGLALEIAWLRAAELPKLTSIEGLLRAAPPEPATGEGPAAAARGSATGRGGRGRQAAPPPAPGPAPDPEPASPPSAAPTGPPSVAAVLEHLSRRKQTLAARLEGARRLELDGDRLRIHAAPDDAFLGRALQKDENRRLLDEALAAACGDGASWSLEEGADDELATAAQSPSTSEAEEDEEGPTPAATADVASDPTVQRVLELFGGRVTTIEPGPGNAREDR